MATLRAIRTRIKSVRSMQKITKAMKMVAASKLRRAQDAVVRARPYARTIEEMLAELVRDLADPGEAHPLFAKRDVKKIEVLMLTSDRGSCGSFNASVTRRALRFVTEEVGRGSGDAAGSVSVRFSTVGRRGRDFLKKRAMPSRKDYPGLFGKLAFKMASEIAQELSDEFVKGEVNQVFILFNEFKSAMTQSLTLTQLLPIVPPKKAGDQVVDIKKLIPATPLHEPSADEVLGALVPRQLAMQIWRALLESEAGEHGARMTAMDAATKNASKMIGRLTLQYNRARQAAITKELMEIVSGAEALK